MIIILLSCYALSCYGAYPYLGQNVHSLQHSLHLPLLLSCKHVQQWFQVACLHNQHKKDLYTFILSLTHELSEYMPGRAEVG